jgi:dihydroxy-acid dehydratase
VDFAPNLVRPAQGVFAKYRAAVASASQGAVTIPNPPPAQIPADLAARSTETAAS